MNYVMMFKPREETPTTQMIIDDDKLKAIQEFLKAWRGRVKISKEQPHDWIDEENAMSIECVDCKGWFTEDQIDDGNGDRCLPCAYACENCDKQREGVDYDGFCDECDKVLSYCSGYDHQNCKFFEKDEMWRCGDAYYCCRECLPTDKRRKRIHPPKIAA
jgi:hypothetical protein